MALALHRRRGMFAPNKPAGPTLVGALGAIDIPATSANGTPGWGASASRAAGNLLVCWAAANSGSTLPSQPTGWSTAKQEQGAISSMSLFYKYAVGADAAPTLTAISGSRFTSMLGEFATVLAAGLDQTGGNFGAATPLVITAGGADATANSLMVFGSLFTYTTPIVGSFTPTLNHATAVHVNNTSNNTSAHYDFGYGITTSNSGADSLSEAFPTGNIAANGVVSAIATFKHA